MVFLDHKENLVFFGKRTTAISIYIVEEKTNGKQNKKNFIYSCRIWNFYLQLNSFAMYTSNLHPFTIFSPQNLPRWIISWWQKRKNKNGHSSNMASKKCQRWAACRLTSNKQVKLRRKITILYCIKYCQFYGFFPFTLSKQKTHLEMEWERGCLGWGGVN